MGAPAKTLTQTDSLGIYVSVPFCRAKCSFCNFASGVSSDAAIDRYIGLLVREIEQAREAAAKLGAVLPERVDTVYFGGGTPSLLTPLQLQTVFAALRAQFALAQDAEITLEAAPGQVADDLLETAMNLGVNRISLGVQSFVDREATAVGRTHTGGSCLAEFSRLRRAGIADIGADLIAGLPFQTHTSWQQSLDTLAAADLTHASVYMLEVDDDSRLGAEVLRGGARFHAPEVASEELAAELYERAVESLPAYGFAQYEISNFARAGFASRHNRRYWQRAAYLGVGLDAHSMLYREDGSALRFANTDDLASYGFASRTTPQTVDEEAAFEESLFLGLRLLHGVSTEDLRQQFGTRVDSIRECVQYLIAAGLMQESDDRWQLTTRGRLVSNEVFAELLAVSA